MNLAATWQAVNLEWGSRVLLGAYPPEGLFEVAVSGLEIFQLQHVGEHCAD
jgi:hypothetical protein